MLHNHLRKKYMTKTERIKEFIFGRREYKEENVSSFANEQRTQSGLSKRKMRKLACLSLIIFLIIGCYAAKMTFYPQTQASFHDEHLKRGRELFATVPKSNGILREGGSKTSRSHKLTFREEFRPHEIPTLKPTARIDKRTAEQIMADDKAAEAAAEAAEAAERSDFERMKQDASAVTKGSKLLYTKHYSGTGAYKVYRRTSIKLLDPENRDIVEPFRSTHLDQPTLSEMRTQYLISNPRWRLDPRAKQEWIETPVGNGTLIFTVRVAD